MDVYNPGWATGRRAARNSFILSNDNELSPFQSPANHKELECLAMISKYVSLGHTISNAKELVRSSQPKCAHYLDTMAQYLKFYGGGSDRQFPFVQFLCNFAKTYGASVTLGEDQFQLATFHD